MDDSAHDDELRLVVRRALLDMLKPAQTAELHPVAATRFPGDQSRSNPNGRAVPRAEMNERELRVTLRGNERSIGLLEQALAEGDCTLEVALDSRWGPRVRVRAHRPA